MSSRPETGGRVARLFPGALVLLVGSVGLHIHADEDGGLPSSAAPGAPEVETAADDGPEPVPEPSAQPETGAEQPVSSQIDAPTTERAPGGAPVEELVPTPASQTPDLVPEAPPPPAPVRPDVVGSVLPIAPNVAPGAIPMRAPDPLTIARERWLERDARGVVAVLSPWLETRSRPYGRPRNSGHLLLGLAHMQLENWNLASRHFYRVRRTGGPLAAYGAWYEAKVDHLRGRHQVAIRECRGYRERYPSGAHADECLLKTPPRKH